jgi:hypothetical protein
MKKLVLGALASLLLVSAAFAQGTTISNLPVGSPIASSDLFIVDQLIPGGGARQTRQTNAQAINTFVSTTMTSTVNNWTSQQNFANTLANTYAIFISASGNQTGGLVVSQAMSGTPLGGFGGNTINVVSDNRTVPVNQAGSALIVANNFGGAAMTGNRVGIAVISTLNAKSGNTGGQSYGAISGEIHATVNDGGTGTTFGTSKGQIQGANLLGFLGPSASNYFQIAGAEVDVSIQSGGSAHQKIGVLITKLSIDRVQGTAIDAALVFADQANASVPAWTTGIQFGQPATETGAQWPFGSGSTLIGNSNPGNASIGIDFTGITFANFLLKYGTAITIDGSGNVVANSLNTGTWITPSPATLTGTSGTINSTSQIINASGTFTYTLPSPASVPGRWLWLKSISAQIVNSASSNVVPIGSATAGTAIFPATAGKWAALQSDGSNWITMMAN